MKLNQTLGFQDVHRFLDGLFDGDLHAKRVLSLANATLGVIKTAALAVHTIGQGLALARGLVTKHAIKQVDRLLSNEGLDVDAALRHLVPYPTFNRHSNKLRLIRYLRSICSPSGTTSASSSGHIVNLRTPPGAASMARVS